MFTASWAGVRSFHMSQRLGRGGIFVTCYGDLGLGMKRRHKLRQLGVWRAKLSQLQCLAAGMKSYHMLRSPGRQARQAGKADKEGRPTKQAKMAGDKRQRQARNKARRAEKEGKQRKQANKANKEGINSKQKLRWLLRFKLWARSASL